MQVQLNNSIVTIKKHIDTLPDTMAASMSHSESERDFFVSMAGNLPLPKEGE